jgi:predicted enzyme related to lactoylglutathione lyase
MVTRDSPWPPGTPCWVDLAVDDVPLAGAFYQALFGWTLSARDDQADGQQGDGYHIAHQYGRVAAGLGPKTGERPAAWTTYLATGDADATAAAITAAGGQLLAEPVDITDRGRVAIATDPAGAVFGLWQAGLATGIELANEPGSLCWNEQHSGDLDGSVDFYRTVFGYEPEEMTAEYVLLKAAGHGSHVGGIGSGDGPAGWSSYFAVADTLTTLALAQGLGATVVRPQWDSDWGPMVTLADDQGAVFSLCAAPPEP